MNKQEERALKLRLAAIEARLTALEHPVTTQDFDESGGGEGPPPPPSGP